ncbi:MAG: MFS transporter [Clostridia bacterium]|nr:MFS transporter [Clostridia bacterium]
MEKRRRQALFACFTTCISMAVTGYLTPLLFLTFREKFSLSYSLLGLLVVINFGSQLTVDLIYSAFSKHLDPVRSVRMTPVVMTAGLLIFAVMPNLNPARAYLWLALGTLIFSAGCGLAEVLLSPTVASIPSKNPGRLMAALHSSFAWGVVFTVIFATVFIRIFSADLWYLAVICLTAIPVAASVMFAGADIPRPERGGGESGGARLLKNRSMLLAVIMIFCGGATEAMMSQWSSSYLEVVTGIPKVVGDILGVALFGAMLGLGRTLYAAFGKNIIKTVSLGFFACFFLYAVAALSRLPALAVAACALTGFCVSMTWPGSLIALSERIPGGGVAMYAMMAAGGDLGSSLCPQLLGVITDAFMASDRGSSAAEKLGISAEQLGMRAGLLMLSVFTLIGGAAALILAKTPSSPASPELQNEQR